jgi:outer membrane protein assembly factor BamA
VGDVPDEGKAGYNHADAAKDGQRLYHNENHSNGMKKAFIYTLLTACLLLSACSTTSNIPDDDQLFVGLTKIAYEGYEPGEHFDQTRAEVEAALATAPNGALFGSSYYRTPFPIGLWIWNWADGSHGVFKKWMKRSFGKPPVLMSQVNPALRASVAKSVLQKNGYLHASVSYTEVPQKKKTMKIGYTVHLDSLFTVDTMSYERFPSQMQRLIDSTRSEAKISAGKPFSVANLDGERTRLSQLMRNNGYYYFQPGYMSFLADTFGIDNRVRLRLQLADSLPSQALRPWYLGKITMQMRRSFREQLTDSTERSFLKIRYNGKHAPMRPGVVLRHMKLMPRRLFSYDDYQESMQKVNGTGVFSSVDFQFKPATDTSHLSPPTSQLDLTLNCTFDQPYDFYVETSLVNRTIGRLGPEMKIGLVRRNAFRGGERLDVNLHGAYEWQTSGGGKQTSSYQYGADASIEFPRIIAPFVNQRPRRSQTGTGGTLSLRPDSLPTSATAQAQRRRPRRFYATPWTIAKVSSDIIRRPGYYKMHIVTGEWTYRWQPSENVKHEFSPLTLKYQFMNRHTEKMDSLFEQNLYLASTMSDHFVPKMRYSYTYTKGKHNPLRLDLGVAEAGNVASLYFLAKGEKWNTKDKRMFKNPYSQFVRLEADITKTWTLSQYSQLVGHVSTGIVHCYGNSSEAPFSELFYVGGANSIRAFPVRSIGPGAFPGLSGSSQFSYALQNGNSKLVLNLELRQRLFGSLYGALFLDAGNVWSSANWTYSIDEGETEEEKEFIIFWNEIVRKMNFKFSHLWREIATGTGIGLRYDLDFLVVRIDWGFGLHLPYDTGKNGYFNIPKFKDMHTLHFAIGYPF